MHSAEINRGTAYGRRFAQILTAGLAFAAVDSIAITTAYAEPSPGVVQPRKKVKKHSKKPKPSANSVADQRAAARLATGPSRTGETRVLTGAAYAPWKFMTGDWNGLRTELHDKGVDFRIDMVNEAGASLAGGRTPGNAYAQQVGFGFTIDTHQAFGLPEGGRFQFYMDDRAGSPLAYYTGAAWEPLQIYGFGENFRLSEMWYEQKFLDNKVSMRAGFFPLGNEFAVDREWTAFINTEFCAHMLLLPNGSPGWYDAPRGAWTARLKIEPFANFYVMAAVAPVEPQLVTSNHGWDLDINNTQGIIFPIEAGYFWGKANPSDLDGSFKIGGFYDNTHGYGYNIVSPKTIAIENRYAVYALFAQQLYRTNGAGDQGLRFFATGSVGDSQSNKYGYYAQAGVTWKGTFADRPYDTVNFAVGALSINPDYVALKQRALGPYVDVKSNMLVAELNYGIQVAPWLNFKPFVQYQTNPGALTATKASELYGNTWVIGAETKFAF